MTKDTFINRSIDWIVSVFYIGYIPIGGGSVAALAGLLLYTLVSGNLPLYVAITLAVNLTGLLLAKKAEQIYDEKDPARVVIDEVGGMLLAMFLVPARPALLISGFFIFRFFDFLKPYPANILEDKAGSYGIMLDDMVAGFYACAVLHIINFLM